MKIAFDVSYIQKNRAGIGRHTLQLIKALLATDKENDFMLHGWSYGIDTASIAPLATSRCSLSLSRLPGDLKRFYWNQLRVPAIETFLGGFHIFHSADPFLPPTRAKTVCTVHDLAYKKFPELFEQHVAGWDRFVIRSVQSADAVLVPSQQTKDDLVELLHVEEKKIHVVNLPVGDIFSSVKSDNDLAVKKLYGLEKPYILFVGTIEPRKNIPLIVKAFATIQQDVDLVIVGKKGWHYEESFQAMNAVGMKSKLHYLEYIPDEHLAALYRRALCFVYPSLYEGYGFPVLEAMASGIPIITSNNSAMREIADGVALLVGPASVGDIAEAMNMLAENEVRRLEMRQRGLHIVEQYTAESAARKVLDVYKALAG